MPEVKEKDQIQTQHAVSNSASTNKKKAQGLTFRRLFTKPGVSPYNEVEWELRLAQITDSQGGMIFEQKDVEVPKDWSMTATNIVASKMSPRTGRRRRARDRSPPTRRPRRRDHPRLGMKDGYFRTSEDTATFHDELVHMLIRQHVAFNSPVWFNVGCDRIEPKSEATNWHWNFTSETKSSRSHRIHAPAMLRLLHRLPSKIRWTRSSTLAKTEGMLFKWGSGTGTISPRCAARPKFSAVEAQPAAR